MSQDLTLVAAGDSDETPQSSGKNADGRKKAKEGKVMKNLVQTQDVVFAKEYWTGDSRDGRLVNGDGYHYYQMTRDGKILEAYEYYERDDGTFVVSPLPEMRNIHWIEDMGFDDLEVLDLIKESEYLRIKEALAHHV